MVKFTISASCKADDGSLPAYENSFELADLDAIKARFGLTDAQCAQEVADNIGRRITNGVRAQLRTEGDGYDNAAMDKYVEEWMPGRKATASPANAIKKMLKEAEGLSPEAAEQIEALLAQQEIEARAIIEAAKTAAGEVD